LDLCDIIIQKQVGIIAFHSNMITMDSILLLMACINWTWTGKSVLLHVWNRCIFNIRLMTKSKTIQCQQIG